MEPHCPAPGSLSRIGRIGLFVFAVHVFLLFFPPIPPDVKGALWSYLLGYAAVLLCALEVSRRRDTLFAAWTRLPRGRRWAWALGPAVGVFALGLAVHALVPALSQRFSREEGLWEPLTTLAHLGSALLFFGSARGLEPTARRHLQLLGGFYGLLALEELDYFGIFGAFIGRIEGVYVGSPHDLLRLAVRGLLGPATAALVGLALIVVALLLWRARFLQPARILAMTRSAELLWPAAGLAALFAGSALEAPLFGLTVPRLIPEEPLEFAGALSLAAFALEQAAAARVIAPASPERS